MRALILSIPNKVQNDTTKTSKDPSSSSASGSTPKSKRSSKEDKSGGKASSRSKSSYSIAALCQISVNIGGDQVGKLGNWKKLYRGLLYKKIRF